MLEFSWLAFTFATVNFLVLVALLYKFLHKPLLAMLERRKARLEDAREAAEEEARKAQQARREYDEKLAGIEQERDDLLAQARKSAEQARDDLLAQARLQAEREVGNLKTAGERERREALKDLQEDIAAASLDIAGAVLAKLVDSEVEAKLHAGLLAELDAMAAKNDQSHAGNLAAAALPVRLLSARALDGTARDEITARIRAVAGSSAQIESETDPKLIAGVRVEFSAAAVDSTLAGVLDGLNERLAELAAERKEVGADPAEGTAT